MWIWMFAFLFCRKCWLFQSLALVAGEWLMPKFPTKWLFWLITQQFRERRTWTKPSSQLIPFHQPVITLQFHLFKVFFFPAFLLSCLTSALISLSFFTLSLLLSQIGAKASKIRKTRGSSVSRVVSCPWLSVCRHLLPMPGTLLGFAPHSCLLCSTVTAGTCSDERQDRSYMSDWEEKGGRESRNTKPLHHSKYKGRQFQ